jgi:predicted transcriptional regulator
VSENPHVDVGDGGSSSPRLISKVGLAGALRELVQQRERRTGVRVTRRHLAEHLGVSERSVYAYLRGDTLMSDDVLVRLLRFCEVSQADQMRLRRARDRVQGVRRAGEIPVLRGLPPKVRAFTGRATELAELHRLRASRGRASAVVISAVSGSAGVGKTALAVH